MGKEVVISTDSTALFGTAKTFNNVWGFMKTPYKPLQVEAIGWKWLPLIATGYKRIGVQIKGIHGQTGGISDAYDAFDRLKLGALNKLLLSNTKLIEMNGNIEYVLVHSPQIIKLGQRQLIQTLKEKINTFYAENHLHTGALGSAKENVISLKMSGINSGLMIDFGHVVNTEFNYTDSFDESFDRSIKTIQRNITELQCFDSTIPISFHLPIGRSDCLPIEQMNQTHWKCIADTISMSENGFVVIENQQSFSNSFILTSKQANLQRTENRKKIDTLVKHNVILI